MSSRDRRPGDECADHVMLASALNMADRDPAKHMVVISRGVGEGRIEGKLKHEFVKFQF